MRQPLEHYAYQVPSILIRCTKFGKAVPTGLDSNKIDFDALAGIQFSMVCPACGKIHRWKKSKAWIESPISRLKRFEYLKTPLI